MERWQLWRRSLNFLGRQSSPQIVEGLMLGLAICLCGVWLGWHRWPYLVLSLSFTSGAIASILAREFVAPSGYSRSVRLVACLALASLGLIGWMLSQDPRLLGLA